MFLQLGLPKPETDYETPTAGKVLAPTDSHFPSKIIELEL